MNNFLDTAASFLRLIYRGILYRKLRSILTIIGIVIGTAVVVALIFLGQGLKGAVTAQLQQFGSNLIFAFPGDITNPFVSLLGRGEFKDKHLEAVREVSGVEVAMPTIEGVLSEGDFQGEKKVVSLHGQPWALIKEIFEQSQGFRIAQGDWPREELAREVVLGGSFAKKAFREPVRLGDALTLRGRRFNVVGILAETGEQNHDNSVFHSLDMERRITGERTGFGALIVRASPEVELDALAQEIDTVLRRQKDLDEFTVLTAEKAGNIAGNVIGIVSFVLFLIAMVAVVVGGIGIMNTQYTSILERRREIGIMKAIGARDKQVLGLFLLESAALALFGGVIGLLAGTFLAKYVAYLGAARGFKYLTITISPLVVLAVFIFALLVGLVAGLLPARQAARLSPAEAARYR